MFMGTRKEYHNGYFLNARGMYKMKQFISLVSWILYCSIAIHLPKSTSHVSLGAKYIRAILVRGFTQSKGKNINIERKVTISRKVKIGNNSGLGIGSTIQGEAIIGDDVMIGAECYIYTQNHKHDRTDIHMIKQGYEIEKPVVIDDDVWIGSRVTILPGVHIGKGVVIGASSVVTKDIPDYSIACGNPARVVKTRQ